MLFYARDEYFSLRQKLVSRQHFPKEQAVKKNFIWYNNSVVGSNYSNTVKARKIIKAIREISFKINFMAKNRNLRSWETIQLGF